MINNVKERIFASITYRTLTQSISYFLYKILIICNETIAPIILDLVYLVGIYFYLCQVSKLNKHIFAQEHVTRTISQAGHTKPIPHTAIFLCNVYVSACCTQSCHKEITMSNDGLFSVTRRQCIHLDTSELSVYGAFIWPSTSVCNLSIL